MPKPSNAVRAQSDNTQSRSKIAIEPRHVKFDFQDIESPFYYNGNGFISAMWAALSATFPVGETEISRRKRRTILCSTNTLIGFSVSTAMKSKN